ncbi:LOW QUALITY PROTEIN: protein sidekick-2-like [Petromyzon marinus]|uniref:LOW QUALITY PROTEIN: protein sidekick-2-like n=1 Tax=Petromyzon marinus TaxID=7757 RepID=UPI003F70D222
MRRLGRNACALLHLLLAALLGAAEADVEVPPFFKREPLHTQLHLEGNRLVLTCLAEGSWPLEFRWLVNDTEIAPFSPENRYFIPVLHRSDAGFYQCAVRNRQGTLMQRRTEVQVAYLGDFAESAERRLSVPRGGAVVIEAPRVGCFPTPQVTWLREGRKVSPSPRVVVTLENQLVVMMAASGDAGTYHAQVMNERNGETKTGPPIVLTVRDAEDPGPSDFLEIVVAPRNMSVVAGAGEVSLECVPYARPLDRVTVTWRHNGGPAITSGVGDFGRRLTVTSPSPADAGRYDCEVTLGPRGPAASGGAGAAAGVAAAAHPAVRSAYLTVLDVPFFTVEPRRRIMGVVEQALEIPCQAAGLPPPTLTWYRDSSPIGHFGDSRFRVLANGSLLVASLEEKDSGMVQCFVRNVAGEVQTHTFLTVTSFPPNITRGPVDSTAIEGTALTLPCEVSGAPKPAITWFKGGKAVPLSSVRFSLLPSGWLRVGPAELRDAGTYTCLAKNYRGEATARARFTVWVRTRIAVPPRDQSVEKGMTTTLHCGVTHDPAVAVRVFWDKDGSVIGPEAAPRLAQDAGGFLRVVQAWSGDIGSYTCHVTSAAGNDSRTARVEVREVPYPPVEVVARLSPTARRSVVLSWVRSYDGNSALLRYILEATENDSPWTVLRVDIGPVMANFTMGGLLPSRTYRFRLSSVNAVGTGEPSHETESVTLPEEPPEGTVQMVVAAGRTNRTIALQWQSPPESQWNGALKGFLIRYRLSIDRADYQYKNVPNSEMTSYLLEDLSVWTSYEVEVAAYNGAGLGPYSTAVQEWTLEGVPTAPPDRVRAEAINSTTIHVTWFPPNSHFIHGVNQGYKLLAWRPESPGDVTVRTLPPQPEGSGPGGGTGPLHSGYLSALRKFTEYHVSVLCYTTPGDGPRSPPLRLRTSEAVPGPVGNLGFSEILDTSLKVSWDEPQEKNGILIGYKVSWEELNKTHSRVTHYLPNSTREYRVTGLAALTTYVIEVSARTSRGSGPTSASTISSGIPPELPGAPSNVAVSNIGPRSVALQFRAGFDGKTSILKWVVEAQQIAGADGEEAEWIMVHELDNLPAARSLEVPLLRPYTQYRFRMRQNNVVGTSPPSAATRTIQTLPAPPDEAPRNLTVRTASESSLWVRWAPLHESQYNGAASAAGYRIRVVQPGRPGETPASVAVDDPTEREATAEGLRPWTEYEVRVQAFNAIGSGPWSRPVTARTKESVPSAGPQEVTANATSPTSILVSWGAVPEADRNGPILGYKVLYRSADAAGAPVGVGFSRRAVDGDRARSTMLSGLRRFTQYEVHVLAFTRTGEGALSAPAAHARTLETIPGPPFGLHFPEVHLTSARLSWQPPTEPNGLILGYKMMFWLDSTNQNAASVAEVTPDTRQFYAGELLPNAGYRFRVTARTSRGWGEPSEVLVITTEGRDAPESPSQPSVHQSGVGSHSVTLRWSVRRDRVSPLRAYTIQARALPGGVWETLAPWAPPNLTAYTMDGLKPFTTYKFRVAARNDVGESEWSEESEAVTTLQAAPDKAPSILSVMPHTPSSVLVQWEPPMEESVNGVLLGYRILYRELPLEGSRVIAGGYSVPYITAAPGNPSPIQAQLLGKYEVKTVNDSAVKHYELAQLNKYRRYEVRVSAYTAAGEGPMTYPREVYVGEAVPSAPPRNVVVRAASSTQLEVAWDIPPLHTENGIILGYKVYFKDTAPSGVRGDTGAERVRMLFLPETSARLKNLTGFTVFAVSVSAYNSAGEGPRSAAITAKTLPAPPSAPQFVRFEDVTTSSLNVSWGDPLRPNGVLEGFKLIYKPTTPVHGVSKIVTVEVRPDAPRWLRVRDLVEGVTYHFRVWAKTFAFGPEADANVTTAPLEGSPGPPGAPQVTRYGTDITLHWTEGDPGRSAVTSYIIEARPSDEGLWDIIAKDIPSDAYSQSVSATLLRHGVSYNFRVSALNRFGCGLPSEPSQPISAVHDAAFYDEWWFLVVVALSGLILILLLVFVLVIRGQSGKHVRRASSGLSAKPGTLGHEEMVSLDERFAASLELSERRLPVKNSFCRRNGMHTRSSPPRPSPGSLRYSDEDLPSEYGEVTKSEPNGSLNEKLSEIPESPSEVEEEADSDEHETDRDSPPSVGGTATTTTSKGTSAAPATPTSSSTVAAAAAVGAAAQHSFVNHYMSDPTYYNSWRRQQKDVTRAERGEAEGANHTARAPYPLTEPEFGGLQGPGYRPALAGFSSFV